MTPTRRAEIEAVYASMDGAFPIDEMARAIRELLAEREWRPIETVPKDGTHILIGRAGDPIGYDEIEITEWCVVESYRWQHVEADLYRRVPDNSEFWNGNGHRATHWQPLPEPPA